MEKTVLNLETVTPMFLHGESSQKLELRPPPFKALFRYWWRAAVGETDGDTLRNEESDLFGGQKKRSPLLIRVSRYPSLSTNKYAPLPHKPQAFQRQAYCPDGNFSLTLTSPQISPYKQIAKIGFLLGGVGNRSRRGYGSIRYQSWQFQCVSELKQKVYKTLDRISPGRFQLCTHQPKIQVGPTITLPDYPVIKGVFFGQKCDDVDHLLYKIGKVTSSQKASGNDAVGSADPRMASPIHVRIQKVDDEYVPVVTQLHSVFPSTVSKYKTKQLDFITAIIT